MYGLKTQKMKSRAEYSPCAALSVLNTNIIET